LSDPRGRTKILLLRERKKQKKLVGKHLRGETLMNSPTKGDLVHPKEEKAAGNSYETTGRPPDRFTGPIALN